jgi:hypothetical protein
VVNVDFQGAGLVATSPVGAVLQPEGGIWNTNGFGYGVEVPLVTSFGSASGVRLWTDGWTGTRSEGDAVTSDFFSGTVELRGLDPGESYRLVLYSAAGISTLFQFEGGWQLTAASADRPSICLTDAAAGMAGGVEACSFVQGDALADPSGVIAFHASFGAISGMQLDLHTVSNPEPTVVMLQVLAVVVLGGRRRRGRA